MTYRPMLNANLQEVLQVANSVPPTEPPPALLVSHDVKAEIISSGIAASINNFLYVYRYGIFSEGDVVPIPLPKPAPALDEVKFYKSQELNRELNNFIQPVMPAQDREQLILTCLQMLLKLVKNQPVNAEALAAIEERLAWAGNATVILSKIEEDIAAASTVDEVEDVIIDITTIKNKPVKIHAGRVVEALHSNRPLPKK